MIRIRSVLVPLVGAFVGCGSAQGEEPFVHSDLKPYVAEFRANAEAAGAEVKLGHLAGITFGTPPAQALGACILYKSMTGLVEGASDVIISVRYWTGLSDCSRRLVVFHELGHCLLGLPHVKSPQGELMSPFMPTGADGQTCEKMERKFWEDTRKGKGLHVIFK